MLNWWKQNPGVRFGLRTIVVGVISYFVAALAQGGEIGDWSSFLWGLAGAVANLLLGLLTPTEPFVGFNKPKNVEVPVPPATPEVT